LFGGLCQKGGTCVWIDVPHIELSFPNLQSIQIDGHLYSSDGIITVEDYANSAFIAMIEDPPT